MSDEILDLNELPLETGAPSPGDPLVALGLVDPKTGAALATEDWSPEGAAAPSLAPSATTSASASTAPDWESPDNPYKAQAQPDPARAAQQHLQTKQAQLQSEAQAARAMLLANGMHPEYANALVGALQTAAMAQAQAEAERIALYPTVRKEVAGRIAEDYALPGVEIKADQLARFGSVAEMEAEARRLQREAANTRFQGRVTKQVDRVEGGPSAGQGRLDYNALEPQQVIKLGIARQGGV